MRQRNRPLRTPLDRPPRPARGTKVSPFCYLLPFLVFGTLSIFMVRSILTVMDPNDDKHSNHPYTSLRTSSSLQKVRLEFYERYGGKDMANDMLHRGIESFGSIKVTAHRMVRAAAQGRPFLIAFAGYSVTVGRGNYFHESFPFIVERILKQPMQDVLGITLKVKNAAIGGIPSFPYGWCLEHFMGNDADIISWDYGMNEGNGASAMESYLRHGASQLSKRPMMIMLDSNRQRKALLQKYVEFDILKDAISVERGIVDKDLLLEKPNAVGFQNWNEFGAPDGCPGKSPWHPKKMEHEWIGWMIAMHLLEAVEGAHEIMTSTRDWKSKYASEEFLGGELIFPPPIHKPPPNDESVTQLMYGHRRDDDGGDSYVMKDISCRTSFLPASDTEKVLPSVVVSGITNTDDTDMMMERNDAMYKSGWVLDVSKVERDTKKKVEKCGGLGYIDMKIALYGIPESGTLRLWLPFEGKVLPTSNNDDSAASHWFDDLIICEANEKRDDKACQLDRDISYIVGGAKVTHVSSIDGAGVYLKRKTCYNIGIPADAKMTRLSNVKTASGAQVASDITARLQGNNKHDVGLVVDISVQGQDVSRANGACCVSHIIWEQH